MASGSGCLAGNGADGSHGRSAAFARRLFRPLPARYDLLAEVLSFGQNRRWRREAVAKVAGGLGPGSVALDVATGTAGVALALHGQAGCRVVGADLTEAMLRRGAQRVREAGAPVSLVAADASALPFSDGAFDGVVFSYLMRYVPDPEAALAELARVLRPKGTLACLEFHVPDRAPWRQLWWLYTRAVLPLAGLALGGRAWFEVGRFLGPSISAHYRCYPDSWAVGAWRRAGLGQVGLATLSLGGGVVMWARKEAGPDEGMAPPAADRPGRG
ncbi:MAG TPA: class I SAM-dependent methyltransferase [Acidimicrobiales bacterium]|nr:class I SAM-dependent methyltransferase [Acidimicrobiales bacterium]